MIQENYSLTDAQIQHFETFGFIIRRQVFGLEEIDRINKEFASYLASIKEGFEKKNEPSTRAWPNWSNLNPDTPYMASLVEDPRIYVPSEQLQGEDTYPVYSNANSFRHNINWHPDALYPKLHLLKSLVYLQPTTADNGSLRVIPGSHKSPLFDDLQRLKMINSNDKSELQKESAMRSEDVPAYVFCSQPGDVITFNMRLWHASFNGCEDRRNCSFAFYSYPRTADEKVEMQVQLKNAKNTARGLRMELKDSKYYHPWWLENPEDSPKRARWIKSLDELGFLKAVDN
jgi:ectoine hydroxylase-related dioxygenase (phytanoyl-CoA dioxygenase family)